MDLIRRVLAADPAARAEFVERMRCVPRILAHSNGTCGRQLNPDELDDLAQDVFRRVWSKLAEFEGHAALETWVYHFCVLGFLNAAREKRRRSRSAQTADEQGAEERIEAPAAAGTFERMDAPQVHAALERLDREDRVVIELKVFSEMTFEEIASALGISANTAKSRHYRGLERLRLVLRRFSTGEER